jgi:glyoxylase I family protein
MALGVTHLDHASVIITDVAQARAFYGQALGLVEIPAPASFNFVALWYDLGSNYLHLLLKPMADSISPRHFCLHVADILQARQHCQAQNIRMEETVPIAGADRFFIRDPDGNRIEILNWQHPYNPQKEGRLAP